MTEIRVVLGERSYPIRVGPGLLESVGTMMNERGLSGDVVVVTDRNVSRHYLPPLKRVLQRNGFRVLAIVLVPGEARKTLAVANTVYTKMLQAHVGRSSTVVALGGGVIGDLAGFVAATYQRGVHLVQVPTTLLAQVDSAIGGKTGVNHPLGKNMIGSFYQPDLVISDTATLKTLPRREFFCGLGEVIKYGIILDEGLFFSLETHLDGVIGSDDEMLAHLCSRCAALKADVVSRDEREAGDRIILNCGHTIGHALEAAGKYRALNHGEAVLMGLIAESFIARELGILSSELFERISALIKGIPISTRMPAISASTVLSHLSMDKKSVRGKNRFVLPVRLGKVEIVENVGVSLIRESLKRIIP